jgi:hypothetical protein
MNQAFVKFIIGVCLLALGSAGTAYVKVYVLENDILWIKESLMRVEKRLGTAHD